jgi:murein L,D-transpeptidase YcbB/YkuD
LRRRLVISGDLPRNSGDSDVFDTFLDAAVKRFQLRHGMPADGVIGNVTLAALNVPADIRLGQLETNLVRLRSMSGFLGDRYVMVNIPAAEIEAVENGRVAQNHKAIVGRIDRQTPILNSKIDEVILNPYWNAPTSIIEKDIIPLMREDPTYLTRNSIRLFDQQGNEVPPELVDWSTNEAVNLRFRQDPGKINAMSSTKINFANPHAVYMHDTPQQSLFGQLLRFESSGCVRVHNVRELTTWLLRDTPGWSRNQIEAVIATGENTEVELAEPVPVYFVYVSAWSTGDGVVHFRDDIYGRDGVDALHAVFDDALTACSAPFFNAGLAPAFFFEASPENAGFNSRSGNGSVAGYVIMRPANGFFPFPGKELNRCPRTARLTPMRIRMRSSPKRWPTVIPRSSMLSRRSWVASATRSS